MDDNKTIIGLLIIIAILGVALGIRILFFKETNITEIKINKDETVQENMPEISADATNAVANKTSGYVQSVQQEKENHNELEQAWEHYAN